MKIALLILGFIFGYGLIYLVSRSKSDNSLNLDNSLEISCPPQRFQGRVTFGLSGPEISNFCNTRKLRGNNSVVGTQSRPESYGTPNHFALTGPEISNFCNTRKLRGPIPQGRNFTYNNDLTAVYRGQPPVYQTNCYQYPCLKSVSSDFTGTDVCWKCGDKPWAGPVREAVNCPPPKPTC